MNRKVILISIDGMRPDGLLQCGNPFVQELMKMGAYTLEGSSMNPSVTLPCHMSIFHSVTPDRHGMTTNTYVPMVRPVSGLFEQLRFGGKKSAMYYGWEPLRDVARPESLRHAEYIWAYSRDNTDGYLTNSALQGCFLQMERHSLQDVRAFSQIPPEALSPPHLYILQCRTLMSFLQT